MVPAHLVIAIAAEAGRDPRTVKACLEGRGSPLATAAVYRAMARLGIVDDAAPTAATLHHGNVTRRMA